MYKKSLVKTRSGSINKISGTTIFLGIIILAGLLYWLFNKNKSGASYQNLERWEIVRNEQGFATEIVVHRNATEG